MKNTSSMTGLTSKQLRQAASLQESIEASQNELTALLSGKVVTSKAAKTGKTHERTPEQKARISEGLKAKWAAKKAAAATPAVVAGQPAS